MYQLPICSAKGENIPANQKKKKKPTKQQTRNIGHALNMEYIIVL